MSLTQFSYVSKVPPEVEDAVRAISNVDDYAGSAKALAATTLR